MRGMPAWAPSRTPWNAMGRFLANPTLPHPCCKDGIVGAHLREERQKRGSARTRLSTSTWRGTEKRVSLSIVLRRASVHSCLSQRDEPAGNYMVVAEICMTTQSAEHGSLAPMSVFRGRCSRTGSAVTQAGQSAAAARRAQPLQQYRVG